jgi:hypothetical protein
MILLWITRVKDYTALGGGWLEEREELWDWILGIFLGLYLKTATKLQNKHVLASNS